MEDEKKIEEGQEEETIESWPQALVRGVAMVFDFINKRDEAKRSLTDKSFEFEMKQLEISEKQNKRITIYRIVLLALALLLLSLLEYTGRLRTELIVLFSVVIGSVTGNIFFGHTSQQHNNKKEND
jgi:hypothetical protein